MPKNWRAGPMTYIKWHKELRKIKGNPGPCVLCGKTERTQWALKKEHHIPGARVWVEDPDAYEALCPSCHRIQDYYDEEQGRKISAALTGRTCSDQHRKNVSAARRRYEDGRKKN